MQHEPANSNIAVPQTVEKFGDVVQDDLLPQEAFLQQLLHLWLQGLQARCVPRGLKGLELELSVYCVHFQRLRH